MRNDALNELLKELPEDLTAIYANVLVEAYNSEKMRLKSEIDRHTGLCFVVAAFALFGLLVPAIIDLHIAVLGLTYIFSIGGLLFVMFCFADTLETITKLKCLKASPHKFAIEYINENLSEQIKELSQRVAVNKKRVAKKKTRKRS